MEIQLLFCSRVKFEVHTVDPHVRASALPQNDEFGARHSDRASGTSDEESPVGTAQ